MRLLVILLSLAIATPVLSAPATPRTVAAKSKSKSKSRARKKRPAKKPSKLVETPAKAAASNSKRETARAPTPPRSREPEKVLRAFGVFGGWAYGGGVNRGPQGTAQVTITPPGWGRFAVDVEAGWRLAQFRSTIGELGGVTSSAHSIPLYAAVRFNVLELGFLNVDVRGGVGPMFALHHLASDFSESTLRTSIGWDAFLGGQLRFPISAFELVLDARFGFGEAYVPFVVGRASGVQAGLGVRYVL